MSEPNLAEMTVVTLDNYSGKIADNVTNHNALLKRIQERGNIESVAGGKRILQELEYAENGTFKWYSGYETLDISPSTILTAAEFDWKQANANVTYNGLEENINSGREALKSLMKTRVKNAEKTMKNKMAEALHYNGTEHDGKAIGGLPFLIADDPTTGTVGGIDRSQHAFWRNQVFDFSDEGVTASKDTILNAMNKLYRRCLRGADKTDLVLADDNYFSFYEDHLQAQQRFSSAKMAEAGFHAYKFQAADVVYDDICAANHMYFLNTDYMHWRPHSNRNFKTDRKRMTVNQDATVIPMFWMGNMTMSNASLQGVMHA